MNSQGGLSLSKKDLVTYKVIEAFRSGQLSRALSAAKLNVSERTITRLTKLIRSEGIEGLPHKNRGRSPHNRKAEPLKEWYLSIFKDKYFDFNFAHAYQYIHEKELPPELISYSTFLNWGRKAGLGKRKKLRRASKPRISRERMANEGLMLQMDGSPHLWNGKDTWCLVTAIDDATSKIPAARFTPTETTWACMDLMKQIIARHGIPEFLLTDQAGWSARIGKRAYFSQFARACKELDITIIATPIPETKGRVERSFKTCQDRLIAEMRLNDIKLMADANRYLEQVYIPDWNKRFSVEATSSTTRYRPLASHVNLEDVFCLKDQRQVCRDHTVNFGGRRYRLVEPPHNLWKHQVTVHTYQSGEIKIFYASSALNIELIKEHKKVWPKCG